MKKIFIIITGIAGIAYAQTVQDINSVPAYSNGLNSGSARYIGMGGSMGSLGGDISSVEQNPAGLGVAITSDVNVSLGVDSYKNSSTFGDSFKTKDNTVNIQNVGATFVFSNSDDAWNRFSLGLKFSQENLDNWINLGRNNNITGTYLTNDDPEEYTTYTMAGYQDAVNGYKTKMSINFGASYKDQMYFGLGMNIHQVRFDNYVIFDEDTEGTVYRYDLNGTPYSSDASGISLSAGVIGKVNDAVRLGLAYHSPVWYSNIEENYYADLPYSDGNYYYDFYYSQYDRNSNGRLVASAGMVVGKSLAVNADYTLHMNGSTKFKPQRDFQSTNAFMDKYLKSNSEFRLGAEYRIDKFKIRAGFNFIESPFDNISLETDEGNGSVAIRNFSDAFSGNINRFSFGAGYDFGGFYLDAAYQFQTQNYNYIFGNADYIDYDYYDDTVYYASIPMNSPYNYSAKVKNTRGMFLLSAGWQF